MKRRFKVLQLQLRYNVNASDLAEQIIEGLPRDRFDITTGFLRGRPGAGEPSSRAPRSLYFDLAQSDLKGLKRLNALWRLYRHCRDEGYDIIIAHRYKPMSMLMLLNLLLEIPACVGVQHGIGDFDRPFRRVEARLLLRRNWRVVGVSRAVKDYLKKVGSAFDDRNTVQINNAIDIDRAEHMMHSREQARSMLGLAGDAFIFGCIGRLVPVKGHVCLIDAFARIHADYPDVRVAIIGEGRSRPELEAAIARHGLHGKVHLLGARNDALQFVRAFDVFVMPSLSEGLPLALLEGMSGRVPVIGSDIDSLRPILEDCGGRYYPVNDAAALAAHLRAVRDMTPDQRVDMGENAYRYLVRCHSIAGFRASYHRLLDEMVTEHAPTRAAK